MSEKFEEWKRKHHDHITIETPGNDDMSVITESGTLTQMSLQADLYQSDEQEEFKVDTLRTMQTYIKKIYRGAKFLSDTGKNYKEPNFVVPYGQRSQSVEICDYLWKSLGK